MDFKNLQHPDDLLPKENIAFIQNPIVMVMAEKPVTKLSFGDDFL